MAATARQIAWLRQQLLLQHVQACILGFSSCVGVGSMQAVGCSSGCGLVLFGRWGGAGAWWLVRTGLAVMAPRHIPSVQPQHLACHTGKHLPAHAMHAAAILRAVSFVGFSVS